MWTLDRPAADEATYEFVSNAVDETNNGVRMAFTANFRPSIVASILSSLASKNDNSSSSRGSEGKLSELSLTYLGNAVNA